MSRPLLPGCGHSTTVTYSPCQYSMLTSGSSEEICGVTLSLPKVKADGPVIYRLSLRAMRNADLTTITCRRRLELSSRKTHASYRKTIDEVSPNRTGPIRMHSCCTKSEASCTIVLPVATNAFTCDKYRSYRRQSHKDIKATLSFEH